MARKRAAEIRDRVDARTRRSRDERIRNTVLKRLHERWGRADPPWKAHQDDCQVHPYREWATFLDVPVPIGFQPDP